MAVGRMAGESLTERLAHFERIGRFIKTPCNYYPYGGPPSFSRMNRDQTRYYAYFRTILDSDRNIKGDEGYYRLLVIECLSTEEGRARLERYLSEDRETGFYNYARDLLPELRIHRGAGPGNGLGLLWDNMGLLYTQTFLPEYRGASPEQLSAILSSVGFGYMRRVSSRTGLDLVDQAIDLVDDSYIERTGRSIGETFMGDRVSTFRTAFGRYLPPEECSRHAIVYNAFDLRGIQALLREIVDRVEDHFLFGRGSERRPESYYSVLTKDELEGIMKLERRDGPLGPPDYGVPLSVVTAEAGGRMPEDYPPPEYGEAFLREPDARPSAEAILAHCDTGNDGPFYPESPAEGNTGYYRFWRDSLIRGDVYPTDSVLVEMRVREMRAEGMAYEFMYRELSRLIRSRKGAPQGLMEVLENITVLSDIPVDRDLAIGSWRMLRYLLYRIMSGSRQPIGRWLFTDCLGIEGLGLHLKGNASWDAFGKAFSACLRKGYRTENQWFADHGLSVTEMRCEGIYGLPACTFRGVTSLIGSFREEIVELAFAVGRAAAGKRRRSEQVIMGMYVSALVDECVRMAFGPKVKKEEPRPIIDKDRVRQAREDLEYVVSAVGTEEEVQEQEREEVPVGDSDDPWGTLFASLSQEETDYLRRCLSGTGVDMRIEASINEKASDTVDDAIVEDGRVYEEYLEDVKGLL